MRTHLSWLRRGILGATLLLTTPTLALAAQDDGETTAHAEAGTHDDAAQGAHHAPSFDGLAIFRHLLNLGILVGIMVWALRSPMSDFLKRRQFEVKDQLDASANAKAEAEARYQEIEARLGDFQGELDKLMADVKSDAEIERRAIDGRAEKAAAQLENAAKRTVEEELRRARRSLRAEAIELAVDMARDNLKAGVGEQDQQRLTSRYLDGVRETAES